MDLIWWFRASNQYLQTSIHKSQLWLFKVDSTTSLKTGADDAQQDMNWSSSTISLIHLFGTLNVLSSLNKRWPNLSFMTWDKSAGSLTKNSVSSSSFTNNDSSGATVWSGYFFMTLFLKSSEPWGEYFLCLWVAKVEYMFVLKLQFLKTHATNSNFLKWLSRCSKYCLSEWKQLELHEWKNLPWYQRLYVLSGQMSLKGIKSV